MDTDDKTALRKAAEEALRECAEVHQTAMTCSLCNCAMARAVVVLLAALDVPYRPGLPSVEQVRAHEVRGGWWQARLNQQPKRRNVRRIVNIIATEGRGQWHRQYADGNDGNYFGTQVRRPLDDRDREADLSNYEFRPCTIDGDSVPWLEVSRG